MNDQEQIEQRGFESFALAAAFTIGLGMVILSFVGEGPVRPVTVVLGASMLVISLIRSVAMERSRSAPVQRHGDGSGITVGEFWWVGVAIPFGLGAWATFLYLARRTHQRKLLWSSVIYAVTLLVALALNLAGGDQGPASVVSAVLLGLIWVVGILHAILIRREAADRTTSSQPDD